MANEAIYVSLCLLLVFGPIIFLVRQVYFHPLSRFPGPVLPAISTLYQFCILWKGKEGLWYRDLHRRYGPVVRCGPNHLTFNDPDLVPIVYHRKADKTDFHQEFSCPAAVFNRKSHVDHAVAKRHFGHAFSLTRVTMLEGAIDDQITKWISTLHKISEEDPLVDWERWARYFSFDVITAVSFGEPIGFLDRASDVRGLIENMDKSMYRQKLSIHPTISWFARNNPLGRWLFVSKATDSAGLGVFIAEIHQTVQKRLASLARQSKKPRYENSMLDQWLSARSFEKTLLSVQDIEDQLLMDMLAGPDSISLMVTNFTFLMAAHPHFAQRAQKEIDQAFPQSENPTPPNYDRCQQELPFVKACVREGLRIVASTFQRRRTLPSDIPLVIGGKSVPAGTSLAASACEIGRHKKLYGENADEFLPDRWLRASPEELQQWNTLDVHWGFGGRKCLGKHIGSMVLYKSIVMLLGGFDLELEEGTEINVWSYPSSYMIRMLPRTTEQRRSSSG